MRLDKDTLLNEVAGHQERMNGPLWAKDGGAPEEDWTALLRSTPTPPAASESANYAPTDESPPRSPSLPREDSYEPPMSRTPSSHLSMTDILPRLDALDHAVERLTTTLFRRPSGREGFPGWLEGVAGDPHSYDGPDSGRKGVCVRILPSTYAQLQAIQRRMGLRTVAAAWEYLLRLGFAAAERLPS